MMGVGYCMRERSIKDITRVFWSNLLPKEAQRRNGFGGGEPRVCFGHIKFKTKEYTFKTRHQVFNAERYYAPSRYCGILLKGCVNSVCVFKGKRGS